MSQALLFPDPKPLVERLGKKFFRKIPIRAGVYKMRDAQGNIVYVGKAKNLRQRLGSYRIASPERMPRRHLRMLREVVRIEFEFCSNETTALKHEAKLIRELKPRFNRAGVWPGNPRFLAWRFDAQCVETLVQILELPHDLSHTNRVHVPEWTAAERRKPKPEHRSDVTVAGRTNNGFGKTPRGFIQHRKNRPALNFACRHFGPRLKLRSTCCIGLACTGSEERVNTLVDFAFLTFFVVQEEALLRFSAVAS